ncbi:MAG: hypothetical protein WA755_05465 [Candidatus Acidiferrales bacterium]
MSSLRHSRDSGTKIQGEAKTHMQHRAAGHPDTLSSVCVWATAIAGIIRVVPNPTLDGVKLKFKRANYHLLQLCAAINAFYASRQEDDSLTVEPDLKRKRLKFVATGVGATDPEWALMTGDVVHNLRSALDHLVCQLAILQGNTVSSCKKNRLAFPACIDPVAFKRDARRIKNLIHPEAFALIEELQPYSAAHSLGGSPTASNLWILSELDIIDKHRIVLAVAAHHKLREVVFSTKNGLLQTTPASGQWQPLVYGTEIAVIDNSVLDSYEETKIRVEMPGEIKVLFKDTGCCDGLPVEAILNSLGKYVSAIIDEFEVNFFGK